jgi:hypothetical protein
LLPRQEGQGAWLEGLDSAGGGSDLYIRSPFRAFQHYHWVAVDSVVASFSFHVNIAYNGQTHHQFITIVECISSFTRIVALFDG